MAKRKKSKKFALSKIFTGVSALVLIAMVCFFFAPFSKVVKLDGTISGFSFISGMFGTELEDGLLAIVFNAEATKGLAMTAGVFGLITVILAVLTLITYLYCVFTGKGKKVALVLTILTTLAMVITFFVVVGVNSNTKTLGIAYGAIIALISSLVLLVTQTIATVIKK